VKPEDFVCPIMSSGGLKYSFVRCGNKCMAYEEKKDAFAMKIEWRCTATSSPWRELSKENTYGGS